MNDGFTSLAFVGTAVTYAIASVAYFLFIGNGSPSASRWASRTLLLAALFHVCFLFCDAGRKVQLGDVHQMFTVASLSVVVAHLIAQRFGRLAVLGAFVTPVA